MIIHRETSPRPKRIGLLLHFVRFDFGASAIEFALIVPFLLMLTGGIVEMTNLFFIRSQLNEIVRDATRRLAVEAISPDEARKFVSDKLATMTTAKGDVNVSETIDDKGKEATDVTVSLSVPLKDVLIFDFVADSLGGSGKTPPGLSVAVTMFKY